MLKSRVELALRGRGRVGARAAGGVAAGAAVLFAEPGQGAALYEAVVVHKAVAADAQVAVVPPVLVHGAAVLFGLLGAPHAANV